MFIVNILYGGLDSDNKYDFGFIENEPLLRDLHTEDLLLSSALEEANKNLDSEEISKFLSKEKIPDTADSSPYQCFSFDKKTHPGLHWVAAAGGGVPGVEEAGEGRGLQEQQYQGSTDHCLHLI